jgi:hypothetical protein
VASLREILFDLTETDEALGRRERKRLIEQYEKITQKENQRKGILLINHFMPKELREFNDPDFYQYEESAYWIGGRILVVYKMDDDPRTSFYEDTDGCRITDDHAMVWTK